MHRGNSFIESGPEGNPVDLSKQKYKTKNKCLFLIQFTGIGSGSRLKSGMSPFSVPVQRCDRADGGLPIGVSEL